MPYQIDFSCLGFDQLIPKAFQARKRSDGNSDLNRSYVRSTLQSWPYMMLPHRRLPPFIHPHRPREKTRQDPIEVCTAIVQMFSRKNKDNAGFIWRAVKMEQERLLEEYSTYSDREVVAGIQAITIYWLLRTAEHDEIVTNFDVPLVNTMVALASKVKNLSKVYDDPSASRMPSWEDWILAESLRRSMIVVYLIDLLFDTASVLIAQGYVCDGTFQAELPLPCGREIWRASTRPEWELEYVSQRGNGESKTVGDLLSFREGSIDGWLSELDDVGTLIVSAASIKHWSRV